MREKKFLIFILLLSFLLMGCVDQEVVNNSVDLGTDESSGINETDQDLNISTEEVKDAALEWRVYEDAVYKIGFEYPPEWNLVVNELPGKVFSLVSKAVTLEKDAVVMVIQYEPAGEEIALFSGLGAGEVIEEGAFTFLDQGCMLNKLIYEGKTKMVWCSAELEDENLFISISGSSELAYEDFDLSDFVIGEAQAILAMIYRTGLVDFSGYLNEVGDSGATTVYDDGNCGMVARLVVDGQARVTQGLPNALRSLPGKGEESVVLGMLEAGSIVAVMEGPVCADGYFWWKVNDGVRVGWTAEGENETYWIVPFTPDQSVDGWVGTIVSAKEMVEVDDYFQLMNQNGSRYGIDGNDDSIRANLATYRDTGVVLQIWGTLYNDRMDAYNTQIMVDSFEEFE